MAASQVEILAGDMLRSMEVLHSISSLYQARNGISRQEFREFVQGALVRQPELQALSWNPLVEETNRSNFETLAENQGLKGFKVCELRSDDLVPAAPRREHVPVLFIEPSPVNHAALGYDLMSDDCRRTALEQARDVGKIVATQPVRLAQGAGSEAGFLVLLPIYRAGNHPETTAERRQCLAGFAVAVFRMGEFLDGAFKGLRYRGIEIAVFDAANPHVPLFSNMTGAALMDSSGMQDPIDLQVANRIWKVYFKPKPAFLSASSHLDSWFVLFGGLAFTCLTAAYLGLTWRQTLRVAAANTALHEEVAIRKRAESQAAAASHAKSEFLASMSHEIRTPLNAILGYAQLLQRDRSLSPEQKDDLASINASGHHLLGLINEVLDLSKIEAGRMEVAATDFDLEALGQDLAAIFQPLCAEKRLDFRLVLHVAAEGWVRGDQAKLRQVLINLLGNAVKFTQAGEVFLSINAGPERLWLFEVIDTGLGIPDSEQTDIFEPFHQGESAKHQGGTGLGLAIARRQVELLGGTLRLQSERGIGSRFYFQIPLSAPLSEHRAQVADNVRWHLRAGCSVRALVVDDQKENRDILARLLRLTGCEVLLAESGADAVRLVREHQPEIIFMDLLMQGMDGFSASRQILSEHPQRPPKIIGHSAAALPRYQEAARSAGCVDFLAKPIQAEQLYDSLRLHLGIEFECTNLAAETDTLPPWPARKITLPVDLYTRLTIAAELHSSTALKTCLQELRRLGPEGQMLSEQIRHLMRSYDMNQILQLLSRVASPAASTVASTI